MQIKDVRPETFTKQIRCDRCGRLAEHGDHEFQETVCIDLKAGYGSVFGDGNDVQIDLCQYCLKLILGRWLRISAPGQTQALMIERLRQFDIDKHGGKFPTAADKSLVEPEELPVQDRHPIGDELPGARRRVGFLSGTLKVPDDFDAPLPPEILREFEEVMSEAPVVLAAIEARNKQGLCTIADRAEHSVIKNLCRSIKGHVDAIEELADALGRRLAATGRRLSSDQ